MPNITSKIRFIIYATLLIVALAWNLVFYRQFFTEKIMQLSLLDQNIIVSFSTTPHRIDKIKPTVDSILRQNAPIKKIYLSIPFKFKRDNLDYIIPAWILENDRIHVLRTDDYGPATKLLGVLAKLDLSPETIIVTLDDDVYYPKNLVLHLAYKAKQNPKHAIGVSGAIPDITDTEVGLLKIYQANALVSILQGYAGVAYRAGFFDKSIFEIANAPQECINSDDIYISHYLATHNTPRQVMRNKYVNLCQIRWDNPIGTSEDALHKQKPTPAEKHRICLDYLEQQNPQVIF